MRVAYAQISGGVCVGVLRYEGDEAPAPTADLVEIPSFDDSYIGRAYADGAFGPQPAPPVPLLNRRQFWKRWTRSERENFEDVRSNGTNAQKRRLSTFAEIVSDGDIDTTDNYWSNQLAWMEANGSNVLGAGNSILAAGRAAQIISGA